MNESPGNRPFLLLCAVVLFVVALVDLVSVLRITNNHDFAVYYKAALRIRHGEDIFAETDAFRAQIEQGGSTKIEETPWPYAYPPFLAISIGPLASIPYPWASPLWTLFCLLALATSCWLALRSQKWLTLSGFVVVLLLLYQYQPAVVALRLGQMDITIFLLLTLAFYWLKSGRDSAAGVALGVAIGIKLFAGFMVAYLLWKRRWRAALIGAVTGSLLAFGSFVVVGWDGLQRYFDFSSIYTSGAFAGYPYHESLNAFFTRTFKPNMFAPPLLEAPWLANLLTLTISALLMLGLLSLTRRAAPPAGERFDLEYALAITTLLLVVPPAPRYSFVWLLLAFIIVAARLVRRPQPLPALGLFAMSFILSARLVYFPVPFFRRLVVDGQFTLSALLLWVVLAWLLQQQARLKGET